jgi:hypothetical protein
MKWHPVVNAVASERLLVFIAMALGGMALIPIRLAPTAMEERR